MERKRGAVDAVAPGAAADRHDQVAGPHLLSRLVDRDQADGAAIDERIAEIARIEANRAVDGRNAHAVAVIAHAGDDALHDLPRMQHARRQTFGRRVGRGEAKDVRVANRPGAQAGAERIADHAAEAGVGAAVRLDGRRMVVRFDLEQTLNSSSNRTTPALSSNTLTHQSSGAQPLANLLAWRRRSFP